MREIPRPHETWIHYKGLEYYIICVAEHSESNEPHVVYQSKTTGKFWVRPLTMFMSHHESGPLRFTRKD